MKIEECKCKGNDPACYECEGSGEVVIYTAAEVKQMRKSLEQLGISDPIAPLTSEQQERFVDLVVKEPHIAGAGLIPVKKHPSIGPGSDKLSAGALVIDPSVPLVRCPDGLVAG